MPINLSTVSIHAPPERSEPATDSSAAQKLGTALENLSSHPIFGSSDLIATPQVAEVYGVVKPMVAVNDSGAFISADPGAGKSSCLQVLQAFLTRDMPSLSSFIIPINQQQSTSIRAFYKNLLSILELSTNGETPDLRARTFTQLTYVGCESKIRKILLFLDEAHRMGITEFQFLKDVYNHLALHGVSLITIMAGQSPNLAARITELRTKGYEDIIGRFASREVTFRSFESEEDVRAVFDAIDAAASSDGRRWTEFFCPKAFANGFRLGSTANQFFRIWRAGVPVTMTSSFTARPFFRAIRYALVMLAGIDAETIVLPDEVFEDAILSSRLSEGANR
ncbi:ATP-binding protein [Paraburkholderia bengalensis]|uniref:ATP-binding protein n=1 Tax=Paraburkholderia bengalensis TaxID=2747562 RepID=A0ABU8IQ58_9BURK